MGASTAIRVCTCGCDRCVSWLRYAPAQNDTYQAPPSSIDARQRVRAAAILPRGRQGYAVPRVARVSPGCRARQRVWPRTLAKMATAAVADALGFVTELFRRYEFSHADND